MKKLTLLFSIVVLNVAVISAQNVAINTSGAIANPSAMLDISSVNTGLLIPRVSLTATNSNAPIGGSIIASLMVYNTATASGGITAVTPGYYFWDGTQWVRLFNTGNAWQTGGNYGTNPATNYAGTADAQDFAIRTNATERMRITAGGNLGIGTTTPGVRVDIMGAGGGNVDLRINGRIQTGDASGSGGIWLSNASDGFVGNNGGNIGFWTNGVGWNAFQIAKATGNVGIGISAPLNLVHCESDGRTGWVTLWNNTTVNGAMKQVYNNNAGNGSRVFMGVTNYNGSAFIASAVMGLSLNGTTTGTGGVGVTGSANNESGNAVEGTLFFAGGYSGWAGYFNADVFCGGTYFGSDRNLKRDIKPITGALDLIKKIDPVSYYYDTDKYPGIGFDENRLSFGFIAQDIEKVIPEMVKDKNIILNANTEKTIESISKREVATFKVVNYSLMIPILTQAIKEQQIIIDELKARIDELEKK